MSAGDAGKVRLGDLDVPRLGYGTMRLPGSGVWGPPRDRDEAIAVLRRAVELGVRAIDSAWYYGLDVANELVAAALRPYPDDLVLITKLGGGRRDDGSWYSALDRPALRAGNERDLRVLGVDAVAVVHLRWMDESPAPFAEALGALVELRDEGRVQRIGLSNVTAEQLDYALTQTPVVSVSNRYGLGHREDDPMVDRCARDAIAYLPFFPLDAGHLDDKSALGEVAAELDATPAQVVIAWQLARSPAMLPIPGTANLAHLEQNVAAARLKLTDDQLGRLTA